MKLDLNRIEEPFVMELVNASGNTCKMDANPTIGGKEQGFRPMELLAGSLAGCASIDVLNILKKQRIEFETYHIRIEADRADAVPAPFTKIHLIFEFKGENLPQEKLERAIELALEKYCSVSASLDSSIEITYSLLLL